MADLFDVLNEENFVLYAAKCYTNPQCTEISEFYTDLNRFKYLKRLINRYMEHNDLQYRLILNHIIVIYNVFGIKPANRMMRYKLEKIYLPVIKPFLVYLNYITEDEMVDTPLNLTVVNVLRNI
tara:strand:+ start:1655 stop:2026 length:372 start_codon:yes stop_codon:yes gene_type:complete